MCLHMSQRVPLSYYVLRMCKGVAVMRRRSDSWLNATQILKVAGFDKPQRTRILEREVQKGEHEKVQGGYGKYQGMSTRWSPPSARADDSHKGHGYLWTEVSSYADNTDANLPSVPSSTFNLKRRALPSRRSTLFPPSLRRRASVVVVSLQATLVSTRSSQDEQDRTAMDPM